MDRQFYWTIRFKVNAGVKHGCMRSTYQMSKTGNGIRVKVQCQFAHM